MKIMRISRGSVQQMDKAKPRNKCRSWRLCVHVDGKRRSKRFSGSLTDARAALEDWRAELAERPSDALTVAQYAERWMDYREQSGQYAANTISSTKSRLGAWCRSPLGNMKMSEVRSADVEDAMLWVRDHASKVARLSGTSLAAHLDTLHSMFAHAEASELVARDPTRRVRPPKHDTREREALSPLELELLLNRLDEMDPDGYVMAVYLMACLGLRKGEALGLHVDDIHNGVAEVRRSMSAKTGTVGPTKTPSGVRSLPMPQRLRSKLAEWSQVRVRDGIGDAPTVCCTAQGRTIGSMQMQRWWSSHRDALGCPDMVMHQLRHSNLSMMARALPSAFDLQRWAGWSSIAPAKVYIHADLDALAAAADSVLRDATLQKRSSEQRSSW